MKLAKVRRLDANPVRRRLNKRGLVRKDRRILEEGEFVMIPLSDDIDPSVANELGLEIVEGSAPSRSCYRSPQDLVLDLVDLPPTLIDLLPWKWEMIGDVLLLRISPQLQPYKREVARAYAQVLHAKTVCEERGLITGTFREPQLGIIYGRETETVHLENGILYKLDVARNMFSSGNIDEKLRMAKLDCSGETVIDMFAGIGYFTLPLAVHANSKQVIACEINPVAHSYLVENIFLNKVEKVVKPLLMDNLELQGERWADRILMGYVKTTKDHLPKAFSLIKKDGIIHYHDTFPLQVYPQRALENLARAAGKREFEVLHQREVKSYSPGVSHMVLDVKVS